MALGFVAWMALFPAVLFLMGSAAELVARPAGVDPQPGTLGWGLFLGLFTMAWGLATAAVAAWAGRRLLGPRLRPWDARSLAWLGGGLILAGGTELAIHEAVRARMGFFDPEYALLGGLAPMALVALAVASWATAAMPAATRPLIALVVLASAGFLVLAATNVPGALDGIAPGSVPLAVALVFGALWAVAATLWALRRSRAGG